jgi:DNA repair exonuclease SbcCD ATPase subunit
VATDPLLQAADRLYGLTLPEFTPARDALAKEFKGSDKDLSARVKALKKPSLAAWVVNLLVRREPEQVEQVLGVGAALREAQASLAGDELRALTRQRRQLTAAVTTTARGHANDLGQKITSSVADEVEATLTAAMIDADAAEAIRSGLLLRSLATTGLGGLDLTAYVAVPEAVGFVPTPTELAPPEPPDLHVVPDPDANEKKLRAAAEALAAAQAEVDTATAALEAAHADVDALEARSLQVQAEIDELKRKLGELEESQDEIDEELEEAQVVVQAASADVSSAESNRDRAEQAVQKLKLPT